VPIELAACGAALGYRSRENDLGGVWQRPDLARWHQQAQAKCGSWLVPAVALSNPSIFGEVSSGSSDDRDLESQPHLHHSPAGEAARSWLRRLCRRCGYDECFNSGGGNEPPSPDRHARPFSVS
jgi:hypothetical protein